ncbi:MAG: hypothetical protein U0169_02235 [Polyangiaceae bacterium]
MVTSACVLLLDPARRQAVVARIAADPRLHVGEPIGPRVPVVVEVDGLSAAEATVEQLRAEAGVLAVDVVTVEFDPEDDIDARVPSPRFSRAEARDGAS